MGMKVGSADLRSQKQMVELQEVPERAPSIVGVLGMMCRLRSRWSDWC